MTQGNRIIGHSHITSDEIHNIHIKAEMQTKG